MTFSTLLTVKEVAVLLQLNPLTVYDYIHKRQLSAVKLGRYYRVLASDLERFLELKKLT